MTLLSIDEVINHIAARLNVPRSTAKRLAYEGIKSGKLDFAAEVTADLSEAEIAEAREGHLSMLHEH